MDAWLRGEQCEPADELAEDQVEQSQRLHGWRSSRTFETGAKQQVNATNEILGAHTLGRVLRGGGNNGSDATEGARQGAVFGTYLHGPVLAHNPALADLLLRQALERRGRQLGPIQPADRDRAAALHLARLQAVLPRRSRPR